MDTLSNKVMLTDLRSGELALLLELGERLVSELDLEKVLELVAETACQVIHAETLVVPIIDADQQTFTYRAASGKHAKIILGQTFPIHEGACGWVMGHRKPLLFGEGASFGINANARWQAGMASSLLVPLICRGVIAGGLSAMGKQGGGAFNQRDLTVLTLFANQASNAIDNARLFRNLSEEKARLKLILDSSTEAIYGIDLGGICTFANSACLRMLGYASVADLIGKHMHATIHYSYMDGSPFPLSECTLHCAILEGHPVHTDTEVFWRSDGTSFPVEYWSHPKEQEGRIIGAVVTFIDITERQRNMQELALVNFAMNHVSEEAYLADEQGYFHYVNEKACSVMGYRRDELLKLRVIDVDSQCTRPEQWATIWELFKAGKMGTFESVHTTREGRSYPVEISGKYFEFKGRPFILGLSRDITERKQADLQKNRLSRALMLLSESNLQLAQVKNEQNLLTAVCKLAVETGGYLMAWIGFAENDEAKSIRGVAQSGYEDGYLDSIKVTWSDSELGQGPAGTAIKTGSSVVNQDYQNNPQMAPWREAATRRGYRSSIALPLIINNHVFGVFSTYSADPFAFSDEEIRLLDKLASNLSYGIETLRTQAMLHESNEKIRAIFEGTLDGIVLIDAKTMRHITSNPAFSNMLGYSPEEIANFSVLDFHRQQDFPFALEQFEKISRGEIQLAQNMPVMRKDGSVFYVDVKSARVNFGDTDYILCNFRDISERKAAEDVIKDLAFFDPLTKLSNRRLLQDRLFQALSSSDRSGQTGALLFIDLDNFKTINDTLGHAMGDKLLQEVAERLKTCIRIGDTVARLGGDEFVVMLEDMNEQTLEAAAQVEVIGEKILATLNQPYCLGNNNLLNTPSIGVTLFSGLKQGINDLFKQADIAMYQAKKDGRNTLRFFDPKMQEAINTRTALENELRLAIERQQFHLHYQIQVDVNLRPLGAESLIRWMHPQRGLVSPAGFIQIAEETGLILPIGSWVIDTACSQLRAWQMNEQTQNLVLSVNVSAKQFRQVDFVAQVEASIQHHGIIPRMLKLELTESLLLEDISGTVATMSALKEIGVQFSLDDFGTGYSSLQYLKKLPLNEIKIDQSFVRDITSDQNDAVIVQTIIAMAETLGFNVIAEGVETEAQKEFLILRGCHAYQGYLFGKPMPIEQFEELIHQS